MGIFLAETSPKSGAFLSNEIPYPFWGSDSTLIFFDKAFFLSVPQQLLILFSVNSRLLNPFKLEWDQSYKITASAKKAFWVYSWVYTLYPHGISLYMMLSMTETNVKALYGSKDSDREL